MKIGYIRETYAERRLFLNKLEEVEYKNRGGEKQKYKIYFNSCN